MPLQRPMISLLPHFRYRICLIFFIGLNLLWGGTTNIQARTQIPQSWCQSPPHYDLNNTYPKGVILPHHALAARLWTPVFTQWAQNPPTRIILFSPNHQSSSQHDIVSTPIQSGTNYYPLPLDDKLIAQLETANLVGRDFATVMADQGVAAFIPELQIHFPNTKVVPLLFKKNTSLKKIKALVALVSKISDDQTVYLASVDFVHELTPPEAWHHDQTTISLLKNQHWAKLQRLDSTYLDAPTALLAFLLLMNTHHLDGELLAQAHAGQFLDDCHSPTTSYQVWRFQ